MLYLVNLRKRRRRRKMTKLVANPVGQVKTIPIEKAIRIERTRLSDIEFETGERQDESTLNRMYNLQAMGQSSWHEPEF
jgi:hypothetical protein